MRSWLSRARALIRLRTRWRVARETPRLYRQHRRFALRRALAPELRLPLWVRSLDGTRFYLSADGIDDLILQDLLSWPHCFFPPPAALGTSPGAILDLGGHHGLYAAEALRRYPDREVLVVEPHPEWCELIRKNLAANGPASRWRVVQACLAADHQPRSLRFDPESSWGATVQPQGDARTVLEVPSLTLANILAGGAIAMIYCNAEGAEYTLVPQLRQEGLRPKVMVFCVHPEYGDSERLRRETRDLGYSEKMANSNPQRPIYHYHLLERR